MKILHLIYDHINNPWVGGGGAVRCFEINRRLAKKGHEITVISGNYPKAKDYEEEGVNFKFLGISRNYILSVFSYALKAIHFLKKHAKDYDIVIEDFAPWNPVFSRFFHKNVVLQLHHKEGINILKKYFIAGIPFYLIEKFYPKKFTHKISVSEETNRKFGFDAKVIPNGISEKLLKLETKGGDYLGFVGRIDIYNKGLDILIKAIKKLNVKVLIAGRGKEVKKLQVMIKRMNISERVYYIGYLSEAEKLKFLSNVKFILLPSRFEGQGIVALEAAAIGKPIIVSDIPELRFVKENGFGISFRSEDEWSLKETIEYLLKNELLLEEMGKRGKTYALHFTWDRIVQEYEKFLERVTQENLMKTSDKINHINSF